MNFKAIEFEQGSDSEVGGGFENKCALCVVLTKIIDNYVTLHRKNIADFLENEFCTLFDGITKPTC
jgi:hypothetical protein